MVWWAWLVGALAPVASPDVSWEVPVSCPDRVALVGAVEEIVGRVWDETSMRVQGQVSQTETGFRLELAIEADDGRDEHVVDGPSCTAVVDAAALMIAVSLPEPSKGIAPAIVTERAAARAPAAEPEPEKPPVIAATASPGNADVEQRQAETRPRRRGVDAVYLRPGIGLDLGSVATVTAGARLAIGLRIGRFGVETRGSYWAPRASRLADGRGARSSVGNADLRACGALGRRPLLVPICAGVEAGALRSRGLSVPGARTRLAPWVAANLGAGLVWQLWARVGLAAEVEGWLAITQPRVVFGQPDDFVTIRRGPPGGARATLAIEFSLWARDRKGPSRR